MKKLILSSILVLGFYGLYAQKTNVRKAKDKAMNTESPDFKGARDLIKLALVDSTTKNMAETWYVAGLIGYKENEFLYTKAATGQSFDSEAKGKAIIESYNYFLKTLILDSLPDAKGKIKPKYTKDIKLKLKEYYAPYNLVAYGADLYGKKNFVGAVNAFELYLGLPKLPIINNELKIDSTYHKISYYTALACLNAVKNDTTLTKMEDKAIYYLNIMKKGDFETLSVYQLLCEEYKKLKDTVNYELNLKEGLEKFPQETYFLQSLINNYIFSGRSEQALVYLETALKRDPNSAQYWYVKGNVDENLKHYDEAHKSFDKSIELSPKFAEAYAGKGRLIFNKAVIMSEEAAEIKDVKQYKAAIVKVDAEFKKAMPFFLKATELKPNHVEYKEALKTIYYRLKMDVEYDKISKEINNM